MDIDLNTLSLLIFAGITLLIVTGMMIARDLGIAKRKGKLPDIRLSDDDSQAAVEEFANAKGIGPWFSRTVIESGLGLSPNEYLLMAIMAAATLGGAGILWRDQPLLGLVGAAIGITVTLLIVIILRNHRQMKILKQLPLVTDFLARSVRAGESLDQAIGHASGTIRKPLSPELKWCAKQVEMGMSLDSSLKTMVGRIPMVEMRMLTTSLTVQRQAGGNLADVLDRLSAIYRERFEYKRQFRAATAASRISAIMITLIAIGVVVNRFVINPDTIAETLESTLGRILIGIAFLLLGTGVVLVLSLLRNDQ